MHNGNKLVSDGPAEGIATPKVCTCPTSQWIGSEPNDSTCELTEEEHQAVEPAAPVVRQLFLDCDGVLADFDSYAEKIFGLPPRKAEELHGAKRFWADLQSHEGFYSKLPLMPDARDLFEAVKHLNPIILTGLPLGDWAEPQKRAWAAEHFPHATMICCMSKDKRNHMKPGDVLVDDFLKYRHLWEEAGGVFVHHTSAKDSIEYLRELGMLPKPPQPTPVVVPGKSKLDDISLRSLRTLCMGKMERSGDYAQVSIFAKTILTLLDENAELLTAQPAPLPSDDDVNFKEIWESIHELLQKAGRVHDIESDDLYIAVDDLLADLDKSQTGIRTGCTPCRTEEDV